jgi:hypothetical protein
MSSPAKVLGGRYSAYELISLLSGGELVLGMRLQRLIYGAAASIPLAGIIMTVRWPPFWNMIGQTHSVDIGDCSADSLFRLIADVLDNKAALKNDIAAWRRLLRENALENSKKRHQAFKGDDALRILGIDYGDARTGFALSDPTGFLASPLGTLKERRMEKVAEAAAGYVKEYGVSEIALGYRGT